MTIEIRLMCDYAGWPLWDEEGGTGPENWPGLSPALVERLQAWDGFYSGIDRLPRRKRRSATLAHEAAGESLCRDLADELSPEYLVWLHGTELRLQGRGSVTEVDET